VKNNAGDKMFIPMNVEGNSYDEKFFNTTKVLTIVSLVVYWVFILTWINTLENASMLFKIIIILISLIATIQLVRFVVFEERYFFKMYQKMLLYKNPTSDVFWDIASIKSIYGDSIALYSDMKIGVFVKLNRGSIVGKDEEFIESHYDAISDFLREVIGRGYKYVHLNLMERADNDTRLDYLGAEIDKVENKNIKKLLQLQLGNLKNVTRNSLYENDYYLIYTQKLDRLDLILKDVYDSLDILMDGNFIGYNILDTKEIIELHKEQIGVAYFNYNLATINTFREYQVDKRPAISLKKIYLNNGSVIELTKEDELFIRKIATDIVSSNSTESIDIVHRLNAIKEQDFRLRSGVDLDKKTNAQAVQKKANTVRNKAVKVDSVDFDKLIDSSSDVENKKPVDNTQEISDDFEFDF
jgi:hypothetical protein